MYWEKRSFHYLIPNYVGRGRFYHLRFILHIRSIQEMRACIHDYIYWNNYFDLFSTLNAF